uniref:Uncharacterized protein n=1 Tax=Avena sativa TaxID=4498 RepID=A0ACD5TQY4_AVESA
MCQYTLKVGLTISTEWTISDVLGPNAKTLAHLVGLPLGVGISSPNIIFNDERFIGSSLQVLGNIETKKAGQCAITGGTGEFTFAQGLLTYNLASETCWKLHINVLCPMPAQHIQLGPSETVNMVSGTCGTYQGINLVATITFHTNIQIYGPFGTQQSNPTPFSVSTNANEGVVGFFGRSGKLVDALGVYVL